MIVCIRQEWRIDGLNLVLDQAQWSGSLRDWGINGLSAERIWDPWSGSIKGQGSGFRGQWPGPIRGQGSGVSGLDPSGIKGQGSVAWPWQGRGAAARPRWALQELDPAEEVPAPLGTPGTPPEHRGQREAGMRWERRGKSPWGCFVRAER